MKDYNIRHNKEVTDMAETFNPVVTVFFYQIWSLLNRFCLFCLFSYSWNQDLLQSTFIRFIYDRRFMKSSCSTLRLVHKGRGYISLLSYVYQCEILYNESIVVMKRQREFAWNCDFGLSCAFKLSHAKDLCRHLFILIVVSNPRHIYHHKKTFVLEKIQG